MPGFVRFSNIVVRYHGGARVRLFARSYDLLVIRTRDLKRSEKICCEDAAKAAVAGENRWRQGVARAKHGMACGICIELMRSRGTQSCKYNGVRMVRGTRSVGAGLFARQLGLIAAPTGALNTMPEVSRAA